MWENIIAAILLFNVECTSMPSWLHQETLLLFRRAPEWTQLEPAYRAKKAKDENDFGGNAETWCQLQLLQGDVPSIYSSGTQ
jgi:hypothetical protein